MEKRRLVLVVHNVRSTHNVGSLLRTAEGLGIERVYLSGYTPYPEEPNDNRLPHVVRKLTGQIHKTALGAESSMDWLYQEDLRQCISDIRKDGFTIVALEQTATAVDLNVFKDRRDIALIVGNEVEGLSDAELNLTELQLEIPMKGEKESFNVAVAAAMALYHLKNCL